MISVFRILFDVSVYYAVTGIYLQAFCDQMPFLPGFVLLCLGILLFGIFSAVERLRKFKLLPFALPLFGILFQPALIDAIQIIPVWFYAAIVLKRNLAYTDMKVFTARFVKSFLLIIGLMLPLILLALPIFRYFVNVLGYVIVMLVTGIACFRNLHDRDGGVFHLTVIASFTAVCSVLCYFQIPQTLLMLFRDHVILEIVAAVGRLFGFVRFDQIAEKSEQQGGYRTEMKAEMDSKAAFREFGPFSLSDSAVSWMKTIFYVILGAVIAAVVILLVVRMIEGLRQTDQSQRQTIQKDEVIRIRKTATGDARKRRRRFGAHRLTVRYYYWRYMRECEKRGITVAKGWTAEDLAEASCGQFALEDLSAMQQLYNPVRYNDWMEVTSEHARQAARLWQKLKKNKPK